MSLIQHVTAQGVDRDQALIDVFLPPLERQVSQERTAERRLSLESGGLLSGGKSVRRALSYDFLKPSEEVVEEDRGIAQYTVSKRKRIAQIVATILACWFASGIIFGFAAIKPILIKEGVFRELCTPEELNEDVEVCFEQDLRLNFFFSLASTTANVSALPVGTLLDRYGPKLCYLLGCVSLSAGSILMSLAFQIEEFDGYTIAHFFLALGGTFIFVPSFGISNSFPLWSGSIVAAVTGAFDASAAVFLFYRLAYEASSARFKPQYFFLVYLVVPLAIAIAQLTFLPTENYKSAPQLDIKVQHAEDSMRDLHDSDEELPDDEVWRVRKSRRSRRRERLSKLDRLVGSPDTRKRREEKEEHRHEVSGLWGALHGKTAKDQMLTPWFLLLLLLTCLQMLRMNYIICTIHEQYVFMLGSVELATRINNFFDWALPIAGVATTPFLGMLLDNVSTQNVLGILVFIITVVGVVGSIPALWAGYVNVILFVLLRPLYYSAMSDYATKVFGFATFGRVYGTIICFSGLVNLSQPGINALTKRTFHDNPIPVNTFLAVMGFVFGTALVTYVTVQTYRMRRLLDEEDAMTVTNTEADSVLDSLLEEDEPRDYGSFIPRQPWEA